MAMVEILGVRKCTAKLSSWVSKLCKGRLYRGGVFAEQGVHGPREEQFRERE